MTGGLPLMARLPQWLVYGAATVGGTGYMGRAPGTNGSLVGTVFAAFVVLPLPAPWQAAVIVPLILLAWLFCDEAERRMGVRDPGCIVLDEFAAMPLVFLGINSALDPVRLFVVLLAGFALFRFFDILKPLGIRKLQVLPGGLGVLVDDLAAGLAACASLHLLIWLARMGSWN